MLHCFCWDLEFRGMRSTAFNQHTVRSLFAGAIKLVTFFPFQDVTDCIFMAKKCFRRVLWRKKSSREVL